MSELPPLDSAITAVVDGALTICARGGPSFVAGGNYSFPIEPAYGAQQWLFERDEGRTWLRGCIDEDSPAGRALLTAAALYYAAKPTFDRLPLEHFVCIPRAGQAHRRRPHLDSRLAREGFSSRQRTTNRLSPHSGDHMSAPPSDPSTTISRGDKITAVVETPSETFVGQGRVHHVSAERFFAQLLHGRVKHNRYFNLSDEGKTWVRGWEPGWKPE